MGAASDRAGVWGGAPRNMQKRDTSRLRPWIRAGLYLLLPTPLLASSNFLFPQLTPKGIAFQALVESIAALALASRLLEGGFGGRPAVSLSIGSASFVFAAVSVVSALSGVDPIRSLFGFVDRQDGLVLWLHFFLWFAVARWFFAWEPRGAAAAYARASFWVALAVSLTALAGWGSSRFWGGAPFVF